MLSRSPRGRTRPLRAALLLSSTVLALWTTSTAAQSPTALTGAVTDTASGRPLAGVLVSLRDPAGTPVVRVLSDRAGNYRMIVPQAGEWTLRAELIGYRSTESAPFTAAAEPMRLDLAMAFAPVTIDAVDVGATQQCRRLGADEATTLANVWSEAKKVLNVVALVEEEDRYQYRLESRQRAVSIFSGRGEDDVIRSARFFAKPFVTASLDSLLERGWVQPGEAEYESVYYGLDAATVLSGRFTEAYCFRLREHPETSALVGLAFEPMRTDRLPDIRGVLWLDRETAALQRLDFSYTQHLLKPALPPAMLPFFGGEVTFSQTDDAAWIVSDWTLRMPQHRRAYTRTRVQAQSSTPDLAPAFRPVARELPAAWLDLAHGSDFAVWEQGGSVLAVVPKGSPELRRLAARMSISGTVWDSTRARPLAGANVVAQGTEHVARTDEQGRFELRLSTPGTVRLEFTHPRLDTLRVEAAGLRTVEIRPGETLALQLAVPSLATLTSGACDRLAAWESADRSTAMLRGTVRNAHGGLPVAGALVTARAEVPGRAIDRFYTAETDTDEHGHFVLCNVPADLPVVVTTTAVGISAEAEPVTTAGGDVGLVDLQLPLGHVARLRGLVRTGRDGPPVGDVDVVIAGPETHRVTTNAQGRFDVPQLSVGSYTMTAGHLTDGRAHGAVTIEQAGTTYNVELRLQPDAIAIDAVEVDAEMGGAGVVGLAFDRVERMRKLGLGSFMTRADIDGVGGGRLSGLLQRMQGIRLRTIADRPGHYSLAFNWGAERRGWCRVMAYLDGMLIGRLGPEDSIDEIIPNTDLELIEVYRRSHEVPAEFGFEGGCGVIALWSRRGG